MNMAFAMTLVFIVFMVAALAGLIGGIIYLNSEEGAASKQPPQASPSTSTLPPTTTTGAPAQEPHEAPSTTSTTAPQPTTTTTLPPKTMTVSYAPREPYKGDDITLEIGGLEGAKASVYLDGAAYTTCGRACELLTVQGGVRKVIVSAEGFANASLEIQVTTSSYANSREVTRRLTPDERAKVVASGKADLRVYDNPGCSICRQVIPVINKIVDNNRECVAYEKLHAYDNPDDVREFNGKFDYFPYIIVEGPGGRFRRNGFVTSTEIKDMIADAAGCQVK
jgi:hypothetical protein